MNTELTGNEITIEIEELEAKTAPSPQAETGFLE